MSTPAFKSPEGQRSLLRLLQREGKITAQDAVRLAQQAPKEDRSIGEALEAEGLITEKDLALLLSTTLRLRLIDLTSYPFDPQMARELKEAVALRYGVVPIRIDNGVIEVATANPLDIGGLKAVEFATGKRVQAVVATRQEVADALAHVYRLQESLDQFLQHVPEESVTLNELRDEGGDLRTIAREAELPPVVKLADLILIEGIKSRGSDVHIEPGTDAVAVRYRIDGILEESFRFPKWVQNALIARLKVMARLDITERRVPQDGRIQLRYGDRIIDLRVSSLPAQHGEKITLRILDATQGIKTLDRLGFGDSDLQRMRDAIKKPEGLILVTGPTGSGKTTTLYALLREKMSPNLNIVTIENPIEYQLKGINQVEVNEKQGLTFAGVLRSVLRQDPDVILVGEIRDQETAQIAMQAAQTGHLVLSTVHTNDAPSAITRLIDLGVEPFVLASTVHLVVAQRLVRRVCQSCSEPYTPSDESRRLLRLDEAELAALRHGKGCAACRQTGYAGRNGVYEVMPISPAMTKLIEASATESVMRQQARGEGFSSMVESAREKLLAGLTTPEEVLRVVQVNEYVPRCPGCQHDVADDYAVCPHCGTVLHATCRECGKPLNAEWTACAYCGAAAKPHSAHSVSGRDASGSEGHRRSYKALVVDDNVAIRDIVRLTIERSQLNLSVVLAEDGAQALALVAAERPDVVILDLQMPGMDGFEVCRRLRSDVRTAFLPVLLLTAQASEESVTKGFAAGADDYVTKPFRREDILTRIRRMLERTYGKHRVAPDDPATTVLDASAGYADAPVPLTERRDLDETETERETAVVESAEAAARVHIPDEPVALEAELGRMWSVLEEMRSAQERALEEVRGELKAAVTALGGLQAAARDAELPRASEDSADTISELRAEMGRWQTDLGAQIAALKEATDLEAVHARVRVLEEQLAATGPGAELSALARTVEDQAGQLAILSDRIARDQGGADAGDEITDAPDLSTVLRAELETLRRRTEEIDEAVATVRREADCRRLRQVVEEQAMRVSALTDRLERDAGGIERASAERLAEAMRGLDTVRTELAELRRSVAELPITHENAVADLRRQCEATLDEAVACDRAQIELVGSRVVGVQAAVDETRVAQAATQAALDRLAAGAAERLAATLSTVEKLCGDVERRIGEHDATLERLPAQEREIEGLRDRTRELHERMAATVRESDYGALRDVVEGQTGRLDALADRLERELAQAHRTLDETSARIDGHAEDEARNRSADAEAMAAMRASIDEVQAGVSEMGAMLRRAAIELVDSRMESVLIEVGEVRSTQAALDRRATDTSTRLEATMSAFDEARGDLERITNERDAALETRLLAREADCGALRDAIERQKVELETLAGRLEREAGERETALLERVAEVRRAYDEIIAETAAASHRAAVELIESRVTSMQAAFAELRGHVERQSAERDRVFEARFLAGETDNGAFRGVVEAQRKQLDGLAERLDREIAEARREMGATAADLGRRADDDMRVVATTAQALTAVHASLDEMRAMLDERSAASDRPAIERVESDVASLRGALEETRAAQAATEAAVDHLTAETAKRVTAVVEAVDELRAEMGRQIESVRDLRANSASAAVNGLEAFAVQLEARQASDREALLTLVEKCVAHFTTVEARVAAADDLSAHIVEEFSALASHLIRLRRLVDGPQSDVCEPALPDTGAGWMAPEGYAAAILHRISDVTETVASLLQHLIPFGATISGDMQDDSHAVMREDERED